MTPARTICVGFLAVIIFGTILLSLPIANVEGNWEPLIALFTSTSAVCVTGLSVVDVGQHYTPLGQLILLGLFQIGGLGYMTATTFLLVLVGRRFSLRDRIALQHALDIPGIKGGVQLVKSIISTTLLLELTGVFLLLYAFSRDRSDLPFLTNVWQAIFHSVSAFNNAGFSLFSSSLVNYAGSPIVNFTITGLIIVGGIGYQVIMEVYNWLQIKLRRSNAPILLSLQFKVAVSSTVFLLAIGTLAFFLTEFTNNQTLGALSFPKQALAAWFQSVTSRTAGFNTIDTGAMTMTGLFTTIALMFIGACPGSTGGGIKTTTMFLLLGCTRSALQGREDILLFNRQVPAVLVFKAIAVAVGSMFTLVISIVLLSITEADLITKSGYSFIHILFEAVSAFATVGLSMGITPEVSDLGRLILVGTMYIGRVGVVVLMAALIAEPEPSLVKYPEETLLVG
ncbi:potassium uptake protein, TrkH family [Thalassoporum mexicanum PCC 7367]|uniref:TrkH family potassium uptake protein n=1 Tax=Thalassoporum mexicanum TaxID=3457544 RepID=UPI00029FE0E6|nr:TrkH family potassium uptake protein [Pseudanabaena sp. PCC 7367]AFY68687.1 potassium uptake protein, TrkH family [Pseudanabaena sp. PCC 7367]